jgi:hypothetical protein
MLLTTLSVRAAPFRQDNVSNDLLMPIVGVVAIGLISIYARMITATPIEDGGDAIAKWEYSHLILMDALEPAFTGTGIFFDGP